MNYKDSLEAKEVVMYPELNPTMPTEIALNNKSSTGKIKLAFKYLDSKVNNTLSNLDSIVLDYHDKSKRKFFWVL